MSILSRHLVMMKSIICQCLERGCIQMVLHSSFCLNMVFVTIISNSEHTTSRSSPLELHFPIPCLPMTKGHLSLSLPILAFYYMVMIIKQYLALPLKVLLLPRPQKTDFHSRTWHFRHPHHIILCFSLTQITQITIQYISITDVSYCIVLGRLRDE